MRTSSIFFCWSGNICCDAFSEKLRLIISSTLSVSTRSRLRIMLYVNRNCDASFPGFPVIMWFRVNCWEKRRCSELKRRLSPIRTYFGQFVTSDNDHRPGCVEPSATCTPCHLGVLPGQNLPEASPIMLADSREDHRFCWHVDTLKVSCK